MSREIPEKTRLAQLAVSNPDASAWVSANAGSGKTYVLAQRVIRLLLRGTPPSRILCLTFTKAAAAHMANEVLKRLRGWIALDDDALDAELAKIDGAAPSPERRARARQLFAIALETPGGLKVQTIHAFCDRVLHQFPFEAGVPAGFSVLEETAGGDLLRKAREDVLRKAALEPAGTLGKALSLAVSTVTDTTLANVFDEVVRARRKLAYLLDEDGLARAEDAICGALGLNPRVSVAEIEHEILNGKHLPRSEWESVGQALLELGGNAKARGEQLLEAAAESDPHAIEAYLSVFCTQEGGIRAASGFGAEKVRGTEPVPRLLAECGRLAPLIERRRAALAFERSCALNMLGRAIIGRYEAMKTARGALDYDDLVNKTVDLLENQAAAWVHYKLDGGIDHILIDEAQDTSPEQWKVVELLSAEFFAGKGASERNRTVFAVGDEKQSIFSFQGADPAAFAEMQERFNALAKAAKRNFEAKRLELSFRSAESIVKAVDTVFSTEDAYRGLSHRADETHTIHEAIRRNAPALVEVWETVRAPSGNENELAWDAPLNAQAASSAPAMLAERIAKAVEAWLTKPDFLIGDPKTDTPRRPNEGDIIVLVRSRGPLFEAILRELKRKGIAVAGADRLSLSEHIAVMDLAALCDALLLPSDDLALACALKSPLFGFSEDELFEVAHGRAGTLLAALQAATKNPKFAEAVAKLERWRVEARTLRPFDFLSRVLSRDKGRAKILSRLGNEASDALDELMAHALAYESTETPSLPGFLVHLRRGGSQVKRDLEVESHAVRVMTVHGVKGLEAPIILLADTTSAADSKRHHPRLMELAHAGAPILVWAAGEDSAAIEHARARVTRANEDEHRRLLYVALTRARDALIVCGAESGKSQGRPTGCWYDLVRGALERDAENWKEVSAHGYGFAEKVYRWRHEPVEMRAEASVPRVEEISEPGWLRVPFVQAKSPPRAMQTPRIREGNASRGDARRRGMLIHRLLQELPRFAASERAERAKRYLTRTAPDLPEAMRATIAAEALAVLTDPKLSALFGPSSRAEVSILGRWKDGFGVYSDFGRVDRLAVTDNEVWIADFKSDAVPPAEAADVPQSYVLQLARYRAVLAKLYPGKAMRAVVIWTANGAVHEIANALLDKAFGALLANEGTS